MGGGMGQAPAGAKEDRHRGSKGNQGCTGTRGPQGESSFNSTAVEAPGNASILIV